MNTVKVAMLKNGLSRYLARVRQGGEVVVFDRDTPIARIVPYAPRERTDARTQQRDDYWTAQRLAELEQRGTIRRGDPRGLAKWIAGRRPRKLPAGAPSVVDLLVQMRRESSR